MTEALFMSQKQRLAFKAFDRQRKVYLRRATVILKVALAESYRLAAEALRALGGTPSKAEALKAIKRGIRSSRPAWRKSFKQVYMMVGMDFAASVDKGLNKIVGKSAGTIEVKAKSTAQVVWEKAIGLYISTEGGKKIDQISKTTANRITTQLAQGFEEGEGSDELADRVVAATNMTLPRASAIARTEVVAASNLGSHVAAASFGVELNKTWLATSDGRERATHGAADGQTVGMNEAFAVGDSQLMFPGDGSLDADASEIVNCRCTQTYAPA